MTSYRRDFLLALGAFVIAFVLWQFRPFSPVVYPLRLFVTFIHELGHGTAAILTGGEFLRFEVMENGAGIAFSRGGVRPIVIMAGYVGTAIFGAVLLILANRIRRPQAVSLGLGAAFTLLTLGFIGLSLTNINILEAGMVILVTGYSGYQFLNTKIDQRRLLSALGLMLGIALAILFAAGSNTTTLLVGVISGMILMLLSRFADRDVNLFVLNFLAFAVGLNAITDAWYLFQFVSRPAVNAPNDATSMEQVTSLPASLWAMVWIILAVILLGGAAWFTFRRSNNNG
jgi:hypothetical protein